MTQKHKLIYIQNFLTRTRTTLKLLFIARVEFHVNKQRKQ